MFVYFSFVFSFRESSPADKITSLYIVRLLRNISSFFVVFLFQDIINYLFPVGLESLLYGQVFFPGINFQGRFLN